MVFPKRQVAGLIAAATTAATLAAMCAGVVVAPANASELPVFDSSKVLVGYSAKGTAIYAERQGNPLAPKTLLVVGSMHGNETKGIPVVDGVRRASIAGDGDVQIWTIRTMNPDGTKRRTRHNARNVDLNRNFTHGWTRKTAHAGKAAGSEVETRNMIGFISKLRPDAVLSFHQHANTVFSVCNKKSRDWVRRTGQLMKLPISASPNCKAENKTYTGTMNDWYSATFAGVFATVELPASRKVSAKKVRLYVQSTLTLASEAQDRVLG